MERFWKWLMRANAKRVFFCTILGLIGVSAWWAWRELNPAITKFERSTHGGKKSAEGESLGIMSFVHEQETAGATQVPGNPFMSSDVPWHWQVPVRGKIRVAVGPVATVVQTRDPREQLPPVADPVAPPAAVVAQGQDPVAPDPPVQVVVQDPVPSAADEPRAVSKQPVVLTYRGLLSRPDGVVMALIEDSDSKRSSFYGYGDELFGVKIVDIDTGTVNVETRDGMEVPLTIREPANFVEGQHAD